MIDTILMATVIICIAAIVYHHAIYPILLRALARTRRADDLQPRERPDADALPSITVIVPAHNEAAIIAAKIENLAALDYPKDRLSIRIALDGCTDDTQACATAAIAQHLADADCRLVAYRRNVGKVSVLNDHIAAARSDIVALSDASATFAPDTFRRAAGHLRDRNVGIVVPTYRLKEAASAGESAYIAYLTRIRRDEASLYAPLGAHGALYFFRRALWKPLPPDTINDDFILPMEIVATGCRGVYDINSVVLELEKTRAGQDYRRRVRLGAGNMQQTIRLLRLPALRRGWLGFMFLSGKGARPLMPFIAIVGAAATVALALRGLVLFQALAALGLLAAAAVLYAFLAPPPKVPRVLRLAAYLVQGYAAAVVGTVELVRAGKIAGWQPSGGAKVSPITIWPNDPAAPAGGAV